ncbi:hypothetical protein B484DRAFT_416173 [Ochromonadaceae sp. CCMP2298]|nr:hypothetical protein B484DRAFT_416173 [Ochromonadaceae sp. CCMP2298]
MGYILYRFDAYIVSRNAALWGVTLGTAVVGYYLIVEVFVVLLRDVVIMQLLSRQVHLKFSALRSKARLVLRRSAGLMSNAHNPIQHFNPAIRAARIHARLPVARFLLCLSDKDTHHFSAPPALHTWPHYLRHHLQSIQSLPLLLISHTPYLIGQSLCEMAALFGTLGGALGAFFLSTISPLAAILVLGRADYAAFESEFSDVNPLSVRMKGGSGSGFGTVGTVLGTSGSARGTGLGGLSGRLSGSGAGLGGLGGLGESGSGSVLGLGLGLGGSSRSQVRPSSAGPLSIGEWGMSAKAKPRRPSTALAQAWLLQTFGVSRYLGPLSVASGGRRGGG